MESHLRSVSVNAHYDLYAAWFYSTVSTSVVTFPQDSQNSDASQAETLRMDLDAEADTDAENHINTAR